MNSLMASGIGLWPSLVGLCFWLLIGIYALKTLMPRNFSNWKIWSMTYAPKLLRFAGGLGFSILLFLSGSWYRDHQLTKSTITYTNVLVQRKVTESRFWLIPQWMTRQDVELCQGSLVDWHEGEVLSDWTFEQQRGCKRVISYHKKQGELDASLSTR